MTDDLDDTRDISHLLVYRVSFDAGNGDVVPLRNRSETIIADSLDDAREQPLRDWLGVELNSRPGDPLIKMPKGFESLQSTFDYTWHIVLSEVETVSVRLLGSLRDMTDAAFEQIKEQQPSIRGRTRLRGVWLYRCLAKPCYEDFRTPLAGTDPGLQIATDVVDLVDDLKAIWIGNRIGPEYPTFTRLWIDAAPRIGRIHRVTQSAMTLLEKITARARESRKRRETGNE